MRTGATPDEVIAEIRRVREGIELGDLTIRELINEGRR
jgi:hypothetical protein